MYSAEEGPEVLREEALRRLLGDMGLRPDEDARDQAAVAALFAELASASKLPLQPEDFYELMRTQSFLRGEGGRHWVALSLREAETVRGALHVAIDDDAPLVPGSRCGVGLRIDEMLLDAVGAAQLDGSAEPFVPPPRQQMRAAVHALRFIDSQLAYTPAQQRSLFRLLRADPCEERRAWFADVCACRRRPQGQVHKSAGLQAVLGDTHPWALQARDMAKMIEEQMQDLGTKSGSK